MNIAVGLTKGEADTTEGCLADRLGYAEYCLWASLSLLSTRHARAALGHGTRKTMTRRKTKDKTGFLFFEEGEERIGLVAEVAPVLPASALRGNRLYSFAVPPEMEGDLAPGQRVMIPVGRSGRLVPGFVVSISRKPWDTTLRPIDSLTDPVSYLTPDLIRLGRWIADYYACPLGRTLKAMVPEAVHKESGLVRVRYARPLLTVEQAKADGRRVSAKRCAVLTLSGGAEPLPIDALMEQTAVSPALLRAMAKDGWIEIFIRKVLRDSDPGGGSVTDPGFTLTDEQRAALDTIGDSIARDAFSVTLLFGVSGSGKTEVYIRAITQVIAAGRQAILLVPEIMLTTQLVQRLASRFDDVALSHSGLTAAQRSITWRRIASGEKKVVIGTRSAIFAPCPNLGLICVDEEQETSYKNLQAPRFHVRDVALMRASQLGIPVVLGSATPSLESWYNSEHREHYTRVHLRRRVQDRPMPRVSVLDMRKEAWAQQHDVILSRLLERKLRETLERGEQAVILMNRRGYATRIFCPACRSSIRCPNCSAALVVHAVKGQAICHYCRRRIELPTICPDVSCGGQLIHAGSGTQRIEEVIQTCLPEARIRRVDSDTMHHRRLYEQTIADFERREIDVLVGTQMVAKGLDFPFVSLVGVINAEGVTPTPDFRNQEFLFQLMTQVAGRAGRAEAPGEVVVQSTAPDTPALRFARDQDYEAFAAHELRARRGIGFPPFARLTRIVLADDKEKTVSTAAQAIAERFREVIASLALAGADVLGPTPCALARIRGQYRYDVLLRAGSAADMRRLLADTSAHEALRAKTKTVVIDVDPVSLA